MVFWSSALFDRGEYDAFSQRLYLWFAGSPDPYVYDGVPVRVWQGLQAARSKGRYFADHIRGAYEGRKAA